MKGKNKHEKSNKQRKQKLGKTTLSIIFYYYLFNSQIYPKLFLNNLDYY